MSNSEEWKIARIALKLKQSGQIKMTHWLEIPNRIIKKYLMIANQKVSKKGNLMARKRSKMDELREWADRKRDGLDDAQDEAETEREEKHDNVD